MPVKATWRYRTTASAIGAALVLSLVGAPAMSASVRSAPARSADCYDESLPSTVEESRLTVPTVPGAAPASEQLLAAGGFQRAVDRFASQLCSAPNLRTATRFAEQQGALLWRQATQRAQGPSRPSLGWIDSYDDRPLYWAHLSATKAIRQWDPGFAISDEQRAELVKAFIYNARGITSTDFPEGQDVTRILVSGFDPYTLNTEPRRSNPSGVTALQLDGTRYATEDGLIAIESVTLPVTWSGFDAGIVEDAFGPHLESSSPQRADLIMTISQGGSFNIEQWAGRWRSGSDDNNNEGEPEVVPEVTTWPMPEVMEFIETTLPHEAMVAANTQPFAVQLNPRICEILPGETTQTCHNNGPTPGAAARSGGGGSYLSNESMYRSNRVRLGLKATDVPGGHLHTPAQTYPSDRAVLLDATTQQRRHDIADQGVALVKAAAEATQERNSWDGFKADRVEMLEKLIKPVEHCFVQNDPVDSGSSIFDGCYDWHSAAHGAYSLQALYGLTGNQSYLDTLESKITPESLAAELQYMQTTIRNRENPYGFAWFLSLVREREVTTGKHDMRPHAAESVARIRTLIDGLTPQQMIDRVLVPNYPNVSWALIHLQLWAEYTGDEELAGYVHQQTERILLNPALDTLCPVSADTTQNHREFFPPCLMRLAAMAQTWDVPSATLDAWISERVPADLWIDPVIQPVRNHSHALNFSRAYALWHIYEATGNTLHRDNFTHLIRYQVSRPDLWTLEDAELGYDVSHWVAQFGIRAIMQTFRDPGDPPR